MEIHNLWKWMTVASLISALIAAPAAAGSTFGHGKSAGDLQVRVRGLAVLPAEESEVDPIGGDAEIDTAYVPELDFTYFVTEHLATELVLATTEHEVQAKGTALGNLDLGEVSLLPPTLTAQYHMRPKGRVSPYIGAGVNYTVFFDEDSGEMDSIDYENSIGAAFQLGTDLTLTEHWSINADVKKLFLNTDVAINDGAVKADVNLDPWIVGFGVGYRF